MSSKEDMSCDEEKAISFVDAIEQRYFDSCTIAKEVLELPQNAGKQRTIELVGFEKSYEKLVEVNVSRMRIAFCGQSYASLREVLTHTKTLILSHNMLTDWSQVALIVHNLTNLTDLVLSFNRLEVPTSDRLDLHSFQAIRTLIIDNIDYDWNDILFCSQMWPNIARLDVWGNRITELSAPKPPIFTCLEYLSLCNNAITDWSQICKLGSLPKYEQKFDRLFYGVLSLNFSLKTLNVCDCGLRQIRFDDCDVKSKTNSFRSLESLLISNNQLSEWRDIGELNKLEKLDNLLVKNNPVFDADKYEVNFNLILSRIENLKVLNREKV